MTAVSLFPDLGFLAVRWGRGGDPRCGSISPLSSPFYEDVNLSLLRTIQKPLGLLDYQQGCLFYPVPIFDILSLRQWKYFYAYNTPLHGPAGTKGARKRLDKEAHVSQIINRTNHEEKLRQNRLFDTAGGAGATLFAFQAPEAGNKQQFLERDMLNRIACWLQPCQTAL